jgi:O-antigen/teichoic acid export membrane protein
MSAAKMTPQVKSLSWRINLLWTSAGTIVYAASNWAVLCVIAKLGTPEMVGAYALGLAVTAPVLMLAQMNLRAVLATDARGEHCFADYWRLRVNGTLLGMAVIIGLAAIGHGFSTAAVIAAVGMSQAVEGISDIYYGLMQRHERMDRITVSMLWKGATSLAAMTGGLWATGSVTWGVIAMFAARLAVLVLYDAGPGSRDFAALEPKMAPAWRESLRRQAALLWLASPLAVVMLLNSLCSNMPRYFMDAYLGTRELGIFAAAASLVSLGNTLVNAVGQAVTPRLAKLLAWEGREKFTRFSLGLMGFGAALGICAVVCAAVLGPWTMRVMFKPEYAQHNELLIALMVAGGAGYVTSMLGYAVTAARSFQPQAPVFAAATIAALGACAWLVPARGLMGAAWAMGLASAVQLAGLIVIFARVTWRARLPRPAALAPEANA